MIEKISGLNGLKNLRVLSLGRNYIKSFNGLVGVILQLHNIDIQNYKFTFERLFFQEGVADTLEELWLSYNLIEKLKGIQVLKRLRVLYISNNLIKDWIEFARLQELPCLENLLFTGNPLHENFLDEAAYRVECTRRLPFLKKLDGELVVSDVDAQVDQMNQIN